MRLIFDLAPRWRLWLGAALFLLAVFLALPALAAADSAGTAPTQLFPWQQLWPIVIGAIVPLVTYGLNYVGPWVSEPIKALVLLVVSAAATALYTALATNVIGFNAATLQLVLTGIASSLAAHHALWKPAGIAAVLGSGQNRRLQVGGGAVKATPAPAAPVGEVRTAPDAAGLSGPEQPPHANPPAQEPAQGPPTA